MTRIIRWLEKQKIPLDTSVLDIGTGNGILLVELVGICNISAFWCKMLTAEIEQVKNFNEMIRLDVGYADSMLCSWYDFFF